MMPRIELLKRDFTTTVPGALFLSAALMLWAGWMLLPHHLGTFFQPDDFAAIHPQLHLWLWMYRVHLFGLIMSAMALVALATTVEQAEARVLVWPGAVVAAAGFIVAALAAAFYYHHGVWGAINLQGKPPETAQNFVNALRLDTEYVTCLVRFGRVFAGLGLVVMAAGLAKGRLLPVWIPGVAALLGVSAMALTMGLPDRLELYRPVFHLQALWLAATGIVLMRSGLSPRARGPA